MTRVLAVIAALLPSFFFPALLTALLAFAAGLVSPLLTLSAGILYDSLYYTGKGLPLGTLAGILLFVLAFFMRRFVKARIMS